MPRSSEEVGAAWGQLVGLAVHACKSCHESKCKCDDHAKPEHSEKPGHDTDPNSEIPIFTLTPTQRCDSMWTRSKGEVIVQYEQQGTYQFGETAMYLLAAGKAMSTNAKVGSPNPPYLPGPGKVQVSIDPQSERGLYVGHIHSSTGASRPVLIYIDDVI